MRFLVIFLIHLQMAISSFAGDELKCTTITSDVGFIITMYRCENSEVVCYMDHALNSLNCRFK